MFRVQGVTLSAARKMPNPEYVMPDNEYVMLTLYLEY